MKEQFMPQINTFMFLSSFSSYLGDKETLHIILFKLLSSQGLQWTAFAYVVLGTEPRALYMLGKSSTAGVRPIPLNCHLHVVNNLLALKTCIVHYYRYSGS
jgi:hypothetical protein